MIHAPTHLQPGVQTDLWIMNWLWTEANQPTIWIADGDGEGNIVGLD